MEVLIEQYRAKLKNTPIKLVRGLMDDIQWEARLIGVKGARGVGKTTFLLQYIQLHLSSELDKTLYVSLDTLYFSKHSLFDMADEFVKHGGKYLFIDEVHKYPNWSQELKNIYDTYEELKVVFTGSSLLEILNARADLSRRAVVYTMQGLSFREFLILQTKIDFPRYSLEEILENHSKISSGILDQVRPLAHFDVYLKTGFYPYFLEQPDLYFIRLKEVINMMLEIELPLLRNVDVSYVSKIKQLLYIISQSVPFIPNVSKLAGKMGIQRTTLLAYVHYLDEIGVTTNLYKEAEGISQLQKPQKIYLDNTNIMFAIGEDSTNKGNIRETFFANQLGYKHKVSYSKESDFFIDGKYTFEVGGKDKSSSQIEGLKHAYIAADNIEYGFQHKIPLWLFGFLY
ncbi:MAG: AAA family ATPase [Brumimicrobium sp.]